MKKKFATIVPFALLLCTPAKSEETGPWIFSDVIVVEIPARGVDIQGALDGKGITVTYKSFTPEAAEVVKEALKPTPLRFRAISEGLTAATAFEIYSRISSIEFIAKRNGKTIQLVLGEIKPARAATSLLGPAALNLPVWEEVEQAIKYREIKKAHHEIANQCQNTGGGEFFCDAVVAYTLSHIARSSETELPPIPAKSDEADVSQGLVIAAYAANYLRNDQLARSYIDALGEYEVTTTVQRLADTLTTRMAAAPMLAALRKGDHCLVSAYLMKEWNNTQDNLDGEKVVAQVDEHFFNCGLAQSAVRLLMRVAQQKQSFGIEEISPLLARAFLELGQGVKATDSATFALQKKGKRRPQESTLLIRARAAAMLGDWKSVEADLSATLQSGEQLSVSDAVLHAEAVLRLGERERALGMIEGLFLDVESLSDSELQRLKQFRCEVQALGGDVIPTCAREQLPVHTIYRAASGDEKDGGQKAARMYGEAVERGGAWGGLSELSSELMEIRAQIDRIKAQRKETK